MKTLLALPGATTPETKTRLRREAPMGEAQRAYLLSDVLGADEIDFAAVEAARGIRRILYRLLPKYWALALEAFRLRRAYGVIVTWAEQTAMFLSLLQWLTCDKTPHVALLYWMSKTNVRVPLRLFGSKITRIVTWSSVQLRYATESLRISNERISFVRHYVDELFWHPSNEPARAKLILAAGAEMRDYETLIEAVRGLPDVACRIAAREIRVTRGVRGRHHDPEVLLASLPPNVSVAPADQKELRALYQRASLVVVPLMPSDTDNGVTVILEAMACGKPVLCSRTIGQVDVIVEGETGRYVDAQNSLKMREAIRTMLADAEALKRMGARARMHVESHHALSIFVESVKKAVDVATSRAERNS